MVWMVLGLSVAEAAERGSLIGPEVAIIVSDQFEGVPVMGGPHLERTWKSGALATNLSGSMWVGNNVFMGTGRFSALLGGPIEDCYWLSDSWHYIEPGCIMGLEVGALAVVSPQGLMPAIDFGLGTGKATDWLTLSAEWSPAEGWGMRVRALFLGERRRAFGFLIDMRVTDFESDTGSTLWFTLSMGMSGHTVSAQ